MLLDIDPDRTQQAEPRHHRTATVGKGAVCFGTCDARSAIGLGDDGRLPPHQWDGQPDPAMPLLTGLGHSCLEHPVQTAMSNSFAFGGNNLSLILTRETP